MKPVAHWDGDEHVVAHASAAQTYGAQVRVVPAWHSPAPLHRAGAVSTPVAHDRGAHSVVGPWFRQAPAPLQVPSCPQVDAGWAVQASRGSWPAGTAEHVPTAPATLQAKQPSVQAVSQQTLSTQLPLVH
jgi:hypothetical protein